MIQTDDGYLKIEYEGDLVSGTLVCPECSETSSLCLFDCPYLMLIFDSQVMNIPCMECSSLFRLKRSVNKLFLVTAKKRGEEA